MNIIKLAAAPIFLFSSLAFASCDYSEEEKKMLASIIGDPCRPISTNKHYENYEPSGAGLIYGWIMVNKKTFSPRMPSRKDDKE